MWCCHRDSYTGRADTQPCDNLAFWKECSPAHTCWCGRQVAQTQAKPCDMIALRRQANLRHEDVSPNMFAALLCVRMRRVHNAAFLIICRGRGGQGREALHRAVRAKKFLGHHQRAEQAV
eukprot:5554225-Alexandrium_andersonii.AAC.1